MATDNAFVEFVLDQIENAGEIKAKKMFALICDNKLFIKPTESGGAFIRDVVEAPPYKGAKPSFLIEDKIEDREWLSELIRISLKELPEPRPKKKKNHS